MTDYALLVLHSHRTATTSRATPSSRTARTRRSWTRDSQPSPDYLGLTADVDRPARLDLGGRMLDCIASPGHDAAAVTFYDPYTGFLLTGDTVYPGRLYVEDWPAFGRNHRPADRVRRDPPGHPRPGLPHRDEHHPGVDYPIRTTYQPDEPPLEMTVDHLREIRRAIDEIGDRPGRYVYPDFVIYHQGS